MFWLHLPALHKVSYFGKPDFHLQYFLGPLHNTRFWRTLACFKGISCIAQTWHFFHFPLVSWENQDLQWNMVGGLNKQRLNSSDLEYFGTVHFLNSGSTETDCQWTIPPVCSIMDRENFYCFRSVQANNYWNFLSIQIPWSELMDTVQLLMM